MRLGEMHSTASLTLNVSLSKAPAFHTASPDATMRKCTLLFPPLHFTHPLARTFSDILHPFTPYLRFFLTSFPRLIGRATVDMNLVKAGNGVFLDKNSVSLGNQVTVSATLDGYSAPLTSGNFVDLARRRYYNNTRVLASERGFYAQLGEREDDDIDGFKDPKSGLRRQIPLEILVDGDPAPSYGGTLDELGIGDLQPALPISAYGAMAMVHSVENPNDASSQFYLFLLDPTSYQARSFGGSVLTGSVSTFGYVGKGKELLAQLEPGDKVASVKLTSGEENFREFGES